MFSFDCETLSLRPDGAIKSIGLCYFDRFHVDEGINIYIRNPMGRVDADTMMWWTENGGAPYSDWEIDVDEVRGVWDLYVEEFGGNDQPFWSKGYLDPAWLHSLFGELPFCYRNHQDLRMLWGSRNINYGEGAHNSLHDARVQADFIRRRI